MNQQSDRTRITILALHGWADNDKARTEQKAHFAKIIKRQYETITPEFAQRLQARTVALMPIIIENAATFAAAAAGVLGGSTRRGPIGRTTGRCL